MNKLFFSFLLLLPFSAFASNCVEFLDSALVPTRITCNSFTKTIDKGLISQREVVWSTPDGSPPAKGWPVVIISQGSWFPVEFTRPAGLPLGGFNEIRLIKALLDNGYAVVAPRATLHIGWTTNIPLPRYSKSPDFKMFKSLLAKMEGGEFGKLNLKKMYATGISSGGYNTSRLAITFPGLFKAIAIQSASYASCIGPICSIPNELPSDHSPTLFLHGKKDRTVSIRTAERYFQKLQDNRTEVKFVIDENFGHGWMDVSPEEILNWFERH